MGVMSLRLDKEEMMRLEKLAKREKKDKSKVARELLDYGWILLIFKHYQAGKISLEKASQELNLVVSETIDLFAEFGIKAPIEKEDYLKGYKALKKEF